MSIEISAGTDDDCPQLQYNRVPLGGRVAENGRALVGLSSYQRMQGDMESQIHNLEKIAYGAVLRAFKAQSNALSWVLCVYLFISCYHDFFPMIYVK